MDEQRARELLAEQRSRIEQGLGINRGEPLESDELTTPGEQESENMYLDELTTAHKQQLDQELAALERAEERLMNGTYGLSVESGKPIPDGRLEALPLAERTVEEEAEYRRG